MNEPLHILILEDMPGDAVLMEGMLKDAKIPFQSVRVDSKDAFIREIKIRRPHVILSDFSLPHFDGMSALRIAREYYPDIPFIIVTGAISEETAVECIQSGADDYVLKSHLGRLPGSIQAALLRRQVLIEKKQAEEALLASETRYRRLFESAKEGILLLDGETKRIADVNPFIIDLLGRSREEILEKTLLEAGLIQDPKTYASLMKHIDDNAMNDFEVELIRPEGNPKIVLEMNSNYYLMDNREMIQCNVRDITQRKQAEEDKEAMRVQLFQAQKMEAIGNLAGGVAHDFNNLMTAIQVSADVAMMKVDESNPLYRDLQEIRYSALRASSLIRQLLLFSRKHPMEFTSLNVNLTIENLLRMLHRLIGEDIAVKTDLEPKLWTIRADANNMEQVVMNISLNARDAMPKGGELTIRTENKLLKPDAVKSMPESRPGQFVCLSIADVGTGMSKDVLQRIFEPFFTTKGPSEGTGLGLSVVYGIVKQHDGWIHVTSAPGKGSAFHVYLPAFSEEAEDKAEEKMQKLDGLRGKGQTILLVEDEEKVRETAQKALEKCGYRIVPARNAKEALEIFHREKAAFDLVFSDVVLSDRTGIELAEEMMASQPKLRVLLSSGYTDHKSQWPIIRDKGYRFLRKPYTLTDLLKAVQDAME